MKYILVLSALLAVAAARASRRSRFNAPKFGPAGPIKEYEVDICYEEVKYVADADNLCWYWECVESISAGALEVQLLPRRCALGSRMPYVYETGRSNPCSVNFNTAIDFECTRAKDNVLHPDEPDCLARTTCYNNGTATFEGTVCWCDCLPEWRGTFDCSLPTQEVVQQNRTAMNDSDCNFGDPPCDLVNGCDNGGTCHNQCGDFWCECPTPFTYGKRCEGFSCDSNPCRNGGSCNRGTLGISEVSRCDCPAGYYGLLCEFGTGVVTDAPLPDTTLPANYMP